MAKTTGPILTVGAITMINNSVFHDEPFDWRVPVATGLAAAGFALAEKVWPKAAIALTWMAVATVLLSRTTPGIPSPTESALNWWDKGGKK